MSQRQIKEESMLKADVKTTCGWVKDEEVSDDAEVVKLEVGESICGVLLEKKPSDIFGMVYKIKTKEKELPQIVCGTTILNKKMANKSEGDEILIERLADVKSKKGHLVHDFEMYHKESSEA